MRKTALILMVLAAFTKVLGFIRDIALSYFYGASNISDAYLIAITIPVTVFAFLGVAINTSYIPMCSKIAREKDTLQVNSFTSNMANFLLVLCSVIVLIALVFSAQIVKLFASGFEGATLELAVRFTRVSIFGIYFSAMTHLFIAYLEYNNSFIAPALIGIPLNFFIFISIPLSMNINIAMLSIGIVFAMAAELVFLIPFIYKKGYRYKLILDKNDDHIKKVMLLSLPLLVGVSVDQINILVDRTVASQISVGGISALTYANRIILFVQGIIATSIATVLYPAISKMAAENNIIMLKRSITEAITSINLLTVPITVGTLIFAKPIVELLFGRGAFDSQSVAMTANALLFYSVGMVAYGLREVLTRTFYSLQDTRTPTVNAVISMSVNIVLILVLSRYIGLGGLALATSISAIICTSLLLIGLRKKIGSFGMKNMSITFIKILCASLIMGLVTMIAYKGLSSNMNGNLSLLLSIALGGATYFGIILFMKIEEVDLTVVALKRKIKTISA